MLDIWQSSPKFDWGPRPAEIMGQTSLKAVWVVNNNGYYYGETSL